MRKLIVTCLALALTAGGICLGTGCNTAEGFGEDVEDLGEGIEETAE